MFNSRFYKNNKSQKGFAFLLDNNIIKTCYVRKFARALPNWERESIENLWMYQKQYQK
jgi:hypothetical protein